MSPEVRARQDLINAATAQRNHDLALRAQRRSIAVITQILDRAQEEEAEHAFSNEPKATLARTRRREVIGKLTRVLLQVKTDAAKTIPSPTPTPSPTPSPTPCPPCPPRLRVEPRIARQTDRSAPAASGAVHSAENARPPETRPEDAHALSSRACAVPGPRVRPPHTQCRYVQTSYLPQVVTRPGASEGIEITGGRSFNSSITRPMAPDTAVSRWRCTLAGTGRAAHAARLAACSAVNDPSPPPA